ncbi:MAG: EscN/YscN/HrcN family type III secretion system ATPase [Vulcanimicrobiaceae bacterium]
MSVGGIRIGRVVAAMNDSVVATLPAALVGEGVRIRPRGAPSIAATVAHIEENRVRLTAFAPLAGIAVGDPVESDPGADFLELGTQLLGRAIDAAGRSVDGRGPIKGRRARVTVAPIEAADRSPIQEPFWTGIRAIDGLLTLGRGARVGIFGGPAAGKSTLIEMLANGARADAVVVGLVGERGREAARWIDKVQQHMTLVVAPSDRPAAERVRSAHVALAQAAELRRRGLSVLVILDSLARFCSAARELAIGNGEAVGRGGYPPSVFNQMARLLERGGSVGRGSITLLATILSDGSDEREPLSDAARSTLDGHIVLDMALARRGHFPAINVLASASRTMSDVVEADHRKAAQAVRQAIAVLDETRDARELGFLQSTPLVDRAIEASDRIDAFLRQTAIAAAPAETLEILRSLATRVSLPDAS